MDDEEDERAHRRHRLEEDVALVVGHRERVDLVPLHPGDALHQVRLRREGVRPERVHVERRACHRQREQQRAPPRLHPDDHERAHVQQQDDEQDNNDKQEQQDEEKDNNDKIGLTRLLFKLKI